VLAVNNSAKNIYIQSAQLNGKPYNKCYIDYKDIAAGGTLKLEMGASPSKTWGLAN
jgi:putative alpha-1,2-mannosidase